VTRGRFTPGGLIPYDLRRTAIRNIVRAGVSATVAKRISGHLTDSTSERYNIVDEKDLRVAMQRTAAYVSTLPQERKIVPIAAGRGREDGQKADILRTRPLPVNDLMAEAGGNRTHRCGG